VSRTGRRTGETAASRAALLTGGLAAVAARAAYAALNFRPPGGRAVWTRTNHRGEPVTLLEGPAAAAAAVTAAALAPGLPPRGRGALAAAGAGAAAFGCYDDLTGRGDRRGFRGHLGALAGGELTSGAVKIGGIGATGVAASLLAGGPAPDLVINAGLVAGGANLLNLFDLRPGRAIKVALATGSLIAAGPAAGGPAVVAAPLGAALALLPEDLGEQAMLGDAGANALGAMLGAAAAIVLPRPARVTVLAAIAGLTAASEAVSFTKVIERTPPLRWLDMLGRRPPAAAAAGRPGRRASEPSGRGPDGAGPPAAEGTPGPAGSPVPEGTAAPGSPAPAATAGQ
jgi:UDP-GlcNAc:undecaprenyl-phosphate/decaprenyl-phosphate GlcNAc-1-phosphate transferase